MCRLYGLRLCYINTYHLYAAVISIFSIFCKYYLINSQIALSVEIHLNKSTALFKRHRKENLSYNEYSSVLHSLGFNKMNGCRLFQSSACSHPKLSSVAVVAVGIMTSPL